MLVLLYKFWAMCGLDHHYVGGVLPTFLAMRGIAMLRIAELIIEKRHSNNAHSILQMA
jgi:hypothetical protein